MPYNVGTIDSVTVQFIDLTGTIIQSIENWTNYSIERDFFYPVDSFSMECADDRADQLLDQIQIGMKVIFSVGDPTGKQHPFFIGFIDSFNIDLARGPSGKRLVIRGRDRLGMLADSSIYPNLGSNQIQQTYQFKPTDTLDHVVRTVLASAPGIDPAKTLIDNDAAALTVASGFGVGVRAKGKTGRGLAKNFQSNLNHLLKPEKGETYLSYIIRIVVRAGCQIKMQPGTDDSVYVGPPVYDRKPFGSNNAIHSGQGASESTFKVGSNASFANIIGQPLFFLYRANQAGINQGGNFVSNILDGRMVVDYKDQPSIIVVEGNYGGPTFKKVTRKVVVINELTGYQRIPGQQLTLKNAIPSVQQAVDVLTSGGQTAANSATGYSLLKPNQDLYVNIPDTIAKLQTAVSRPKYVVDYNSQNDEELQLYAAELMAHYQDKYFTLEYQVEGHSNGGAIWSTNFMCAVTDQSFHPTKSINGSFWIKKVVFSRNRGSGCITHLTLTLPYTHLYSLSGTNNNG